MLTCAYVCGCVCVVLFVVQSKILMHSVFGHKYTSYAYRTTCLFASYLVGLLLILQLILFEVCAWPAPAIGVNPGRLEIAIPRFWDGDRTHGVSMKYYCIL